jgi:hypothetical protein
VTDRTRPPITSAQLVRAGRIWRVATIRKREFLVLMAYGYQSDSVALMEWPDIGLENQKCIADTISDLQALLSYGVSDEQSNNRSRGRAPESER